MTEGKIVEWKKKEGDRVAEGETVCILETEKITCEVEAPVPGILSKVMAKEGDVVAVGTIVALILQPGESVAEIPIEAKPEKRKLKLKQKK